MADEASSQQVTDLIGDLHKTHQEPVWRYDDGSFGCPFDQLTESNNSHTITAPPWFRDARTKGEA